MEKLNKNATIAARFVLGLIFVVFGLNGFLHFIPMAAPTGAMGTMMGGLAASGYFFPLLKTTEILIGLALLTGRFVPLALVVLAPISINIFAVHAFLAPEGLAMGVMVVGAQLFLAYSYRDAFKALLNPNAKPATARAANSVVPATNIA